VSAGLAWPPAVAVAVTVLALASLVAEHPRWRRLARAGPGWTVRAPSLTSLAGLDAVRLGGTCDIDGMENRFRQLPPRIEPRYETQDVSGQPPLPEVPETIGLTVAGQVADLERLAGALARAPRPDPARPVSSGPARPGGRRWMLVALFGTLALVMIAVVLVSRFG
jgi:hypothetical protein